MAAENGMAKSLRNAAVISGIGMSPKPTNTPPQYADRQFQYFDAETRAFAFMKAKYSSDFVEAQVQGIEPGKPYDWGFYRIRIANLVTMTASVQRNFDDYKKFLFESYNVEYVRQGTKIVTMGNTWLVTNPDNTSGASGSGTMRRCNAVWNHLDYYGNVVSEPIIVTNERANANESDQQSSQLISKGYFNVICQYNPETAQIDTNTRIILGTAAYRVTGYSDFETEFTGDYSSVRLLSFSIRYEEPNTVIDDMENHVASGKTFRWEISLSGSASIQAGNTVQITAESRRSGESVTDSTERPVGYIWTSSDENVLTVDADGLVTAIAPGTATVTAALAQNPAYSAETVIEVTDVEDGVFFTTTVPQSISAFQTVAISAAYFEDGEETAQEIAFELSGADTNAYTAKVSGNTVVLSGFGYSTIPLTVTARYGTFEATAVIGLEGI